MKYTQIGNELSHPSAMAQAAKALDAAASLAVGSKDTDSLIRIAESWIAIGVNLLVEVPEEDLEVSDCTEEGKVGFGFNDGVAR